ncbi:hypothetical protein LTR37_009985 [Vermiconidia calcicola]|uniref:Uncharacterized protein n=1 Tax=Vermiconidia calcicola TaxID=1690605 RepID=A0ACC3N730_9PEZI|nr:hypothetical protein LTR37_009985 [Vermiconidia calcicola]
MYPQLESARYHAILAERCYLLPNLSLRQQKQYRHEATMIRRRLEDLEGPPSMPGYCASYPGPAFLTPSVSQPCAHRAPSSRLSLEGLPAEVLKEIYIYTALSEQENDLEYAGNGQDTRDFCLPLDKVRPPNLSRVSKKFRAEYLPIFFMTVCFRVYVDGGPLAGITDTMWDNDGPMTGVADPICIDLPPAVRTWLQSLSLPSRKDIHFRNLQYRPRYPEGSQICSNLNVIFDNKVQKYNIDWRCDEGWGLGTALPGTRQVIEEKGRLVEDSLLAMQILSLLKLMSGSSMEAGLGVPQPLRMLAWTRRTYSCLVLGHYALGAAKLSMLEGLRKHYMWAI